MCASVKWSISPDEHGFVSDRATATYVATISQYISECFNDCRQVDVYKDFSLV